MASSKSSAAPRKTLHAQKDMLERKFEMAGVNQRQAEETVGAIMSPQALRSMDHHGDESDGINFIATQLANIPTRIVAIVLSVATAPLLTFVHGMFASLVMYLLVTTTLHQFNTLSPTFNLNTLTRDLKTSIQRQLTNQLLEKRSKQLIEQYKKNKQLQLRLPPSPWVTGLFANYSTFRASVPPPLDALTPSVQLAVVFCGMVVAISDLGLDVCTFVELVTNGRPAERKKAAEILIRWLPSNQRFEEAITEATQLVELAPPRPAATAQVAAHTNGARFPTEWAKSKRFGKFLRKASEYYRIMRRISHNNGVEKPAVYGPRRLCRKVMRCIEDHPEQRDELRYVWAHVLHSLVRLHKLEGLQMTEEKDKREGRQMPEDENCSIVACTPKTPCPHGNPEHKLALQYLHAYTTLGITRLLTNLNPDLLQTVQNSLKAQGSFSETVHGKKLGDLFKTNEFYKRMSREGAQNLYNLGSTVASSMAVATAAHVTHPHRDASTSKHGAESKRTILDDLRDLVSGVKQSVGQIFPEWTDGGSEADGGSPTTALLSLPSNDIQHGDHSQDAGSQSGHQQDGTLQGDHSQGGDSQDGTSQGGGSQGGGSQDGTSQGGGSQGGGSQDGTSQGGGSHGGGSQDGTSQGGQRDFSTAGPSIHDDAINRYDTESHMDVDGNDQDSMRRYVDHVKETRAAIHDLSLRHPDDKDMQTLQKAYDESVNNLIGASSPTTQLVNGTHSLEQQITAMHAASSYRNMAHQEEASMGAMRQSLNDLRNTSVDTKPMEDMVQRYDDAAKGWRLKASEAEAAHPNSRPSGVGATGLFASGAGVGAASVGAVSYIAARQKRLSFRR
jgi:hypothetical protein